MLAVLVEVLLQDQEVVLEVLAVLDLMVLTDLPQVH